MFHRSGRNTGIVTRRRQGGFSLLETLAATVIVGISVMAAVRTYSAGAQGRSDARMSSRALRIIEHRLEALSARGAERLPSCPAPAPCRAEGNAYAPAKSDAGGYPCTQYLSDARLPDPERRDGVGRFRVDTTVWIHPDPEQRSESRMLTISVCWRNGRGRIRTLSGDRLVLDAETP